MPVKIYSNSEDAINGALLRAYDALRERETGMTKQLSLLQSEIAKVRAAIASMRPLIGADQEDSKQDSLLPSLEGSGTGAFDGLPFSKALRVFMRSVNGPLTAKEITERFAQAGYKYNTESPLNQVLVSLTRGEGKFYERLDNKWMYKETTVVHA